MTQPLQQTDYAALIQKAREEAAPHRKRLDAGEWISDFSFMTVEKLATALEELLEELLAEREELTVEWGFLYEVSSSEEIMVACDNEEQARANVAASPTDTGLQRRLVTSWKAVD